MWDVKRLLDSCLEKERVLADSQDGKQSVVLPISEYGMGFSSFESGKIIAVNDMFASIIGVVNSEL